MLAQEGDISPIGGLPWSRFSEGCIDINDNRDIAFCAQISAPQSVDSVIVRNGEVVVQEGKTQLSQILGELKSLGGRRVRIANTGEVIYWGSVTDEPAHRDTAIFADTRAIVREGVHLFEETLRIQAFSNTRFEISPNGRFLIFHAIPDSGPRGVFLFDRGSDRARQEARNGRNVNALCLSSAGYPILGSSWPAHVDATHHPGATFSILFAHSSPIDGVILPFGELLVDVGSPQLSIQSAPAAPGDFTIDVPNDPAWIGASGHIQALIVGGGRFELCNAIQPTAGR